MQGALLKAVKKLVGQKVVIHKVPWYVECMVRVWMCEVRVGYV